MRIKAIISAGGNGVRLHNITRSVIPKGLCRIVDVPILSYQLFALNRCDILDIMISVEKDWQVAEIQQSIRIGEFPKINYFLTKHRYGHPLMAFESKIVKEFIGKSDFIWTYGDLVYGPDLLDSMLMKYKNKPTSSYGCNVIAKDLRPTNENYTSYVLNSNNQVTSYKKNRLRPSHTIDAPFIFKNYVLDIIRNELKKKKPRGTNVVNRIIDNHELIVVRADKYVNLNRPSNLNKLKRLIYSGNVISHKNTK